VGLIRGLVADLSDTAQLAVDHRQHARRPAVDEPRHPLRAHDAGAIVSTAGAFVCSAGLFERGPRLYDPQVSYGKILVGVDRPSDDAASQIEGALRLDSGEW